MPYALKNRCVIRADTGAIVKCHRTRTMALKHLAALQINVPEMKAEAERTPMTRAEAARHASLVRWKKEQAFAPQTGGMANPKIRARVAEILAEKANKGKKKAKGGKGKADAAKKRAEAAAKKAERVKAQAAKKQEREKAKIARDMERTAKQAERAKAKTERVAAQAKKQAERQAKLKQAAAKQKAKSKAGAQAKQERARQQQTKQVERAQSAKERTEAQAKKQAEAQSKQKQSEADRAEKQAAADKRKKRILAEKVKRGEKLSASDQIDAEDAGLIKAGKAMTTIELPSDLADSYTLAIKAGARHSRTDMQHIQAIHDSAVACGADCATGNDEDDDEMDMDGAEKAIKGIMDDPGYYAQHECGDIMQASNALSTMAMLIQSELAEEDEDTAHIEMLCDAARTLVDFISSELDELEQAAKDDAEEDATIGHEPMKALRAIAILERGTVGDLEYVEQWMGEQIEPSLKAIEKREDVNPKAGISKYGAVTFADAKNKKYPIDTADHVRAAWNYIAKEANAAKYDPDEVAQIKAKIIAAWKKLIDKAGPPSAGKAVELDEQFFAVKSIGDDGIMGPGVRYGSPDEPDISEHRDYFTKSTNYYLDAWDKRPMLWHHAVPQTDLIDALRRAGADQEEIKAMREAIVYLDQNPVIGTWTKAIADPAAVWMNGVLDRAHRYRAAIKRMVDLGMLKISTDSIPQMVRREKQPNGTNEVKSWPIVAASLTPQAAEPRLFDVQAIKSIYETAGLEFPFTFDDELETKSDDDRARALLLELELLEIELSATL